MNDLNKALAAGDNLLKKLAANERLRRWRKRNFRADNRLASIGADGVERTVSRTVRRKPRA